MKKKKLDDLHQPTPQHPVNHSNGDCGADIKIDIQVHEAELKILEKNSFILTKMPTQSNVERMVSKNGAEITGYAYARK